MPTIRIEVGGQSFEAPLPPSPVSIGASEDSDLRLQCEGVAAHHCTLEPLPDGRHKLQDGNSGLGTLVNGRVARQISLSEGDVIEIGQARIVYSLAGGAVAAPAPATPAAPAPAAVPAMPARPARAAPAQAADPRPVAARPADPLPVDAPTPTPAPAAAAPARAEKGKGERPQKNKSGLVIGALVGVAVLVALVIGLGSLGGSDEDDPALLQALEQGTRAYESRNYSEARALFTQVAEEGRNTSLGRRANDKLRLLNTVESEMEQRLATIWAGRLDLDADALARARTSFAGAYGDSQLGRFDEMRAKVAAARVAWKTDELAALTAETQGLVQGARFSEAEEAWERFGNAAPAGVDVRAEVAAALAQLRADAETKADSLEASADEWIQAGQAFRSVKLLSDMVPRFEGLAPKARLEKALARAVSARDKPIQIDRTKPGPDAGTRTPKPTPRPPPLQPPTDDDQAKALEAKIADVRARAQASITKRQFQDAADAIQKALPELPELPGLGKARSALADFAVDCALAEVGLGRLIASIHENPKRYGNVKLTERLTVSLLDADREKLSARVKGGTSKWGWERVAAAAFSGLVERMRPEADDALSVAGLLHVVGEDDAAAGALYAAGEKGVPTAQLFPVLARWKQEPIPEGGYVVYEKRYVTPAEKAFLIQEAAIAAALKKVDAKDAGVRQAAYEALLAIGEPAAARTTDALQRRRAYLISQVASSAGAIGSKYMPKLLQLLGERREHALALINDAQAYPYPNPNKKNQKEVEARVDQVREVWQRPFDLVAQWDGKLKESLSVITEVDEVLSRIDSGYSPDLEEVKDRINKAINVPAAADSNIRDYSLKVLAYNTTLDTTATLEEKNNVRSVNDYRMMMGLVAVRINERLQRAARGHSRHMQTNGYFAHDVPSAYATPENRTPGARCKVQGFGSGVGENIARGPDTGFGAFLAWFGSSGHHRNMLGKGWVQMGCGRAGGTWWTQNFGGGSKSLTPPDPLPAPAAAFAPDPEDQKGRPLPPGASQVPDEAPPSDQPDEPGDGSDDDGR